MDTHTSQVIYISHGGGPLPLLGDPGHSQMVRTLKELAGQLRRPSAILVISAHWEEGMPTLTSGPDPSLIYDYFGFPQQAYEIEYPCPGAPDLAQKVYDTLEAEGLKPALDDQRGFDHGLFIPLKIMYPQADIPCIQLSLVKGLDPALHIQMGRALVDLDQENLLVIGSGFSFHNMQAFFAPETGETRQMNAAFDAWLVETCSSGELSETGRQHRLENWEQAPHARYCHPREEHLLPLHCCLGLAGKACDTFFGLEILKKKSSMYIWK